MAAGHAYHPETGSSASGDPASSLASRRRRRTESPASWRHPWTTYRVTSGNSLLTKHSLLAAKKPNA